MDTWAYVKASTRSITNHLGSNTRYGGYTACGLRSVSYRWDYREANLEAPDSSTCRRCLTIAKRQEAELAAKATTAPEED